MARILNLLNCVLMATICSAHLQMQQPIMKSASSGHSWGYNKDTGPISWYGLDPLANSLCSKGRHQSPINIEPEKVPLTVNGVWLNLSRIESAIMKNNGHTVQVDFPDNYQGTLVHDGTTYSLKQYHFHTPSEHHLNGIHYDTEMHMVFASTKGTFAVLAQTYAVGKDNSDAFLRMIPDDISDIAKPGSIRKVGPIDFTAIVARWKNEPSYTYPGSLTTPPCTEGVTWFIAQTALPIYYNQHSILRSIMGFNARTVQNQYAEENLLMGAGKALKKHGNLCAASVGSLN